MYKLFKVQSSTTAKTLYVEALLVSLLVRSSVKSSNFRTLTFFLSQEQIKDPLLQLEHFLKLQSKVQFKHSQWEHFSNCLKCSLFLALKSWRRAMIGVDLNIENKDFFLQSASAESKSLVYSWSIDALVKYFRIFKSLSETKGDISLIA